MTITTKENAAGRISGYYVDGKRVAKKDLEAMLTGGSDEIITVDYSVALALKPMSNYYVMQNLKVIVTGVYQSGVLMTQKAAEAQGLELGRGWSGAIKALWRVKSSAQTVDTAAEEVVDSETQETVDTAGSFIVSVYTERTDEQGTLWRGMEVEKVETSQAAAQFVIDFANQNPNYTVTEFIIKKFGKGHGEYRSTDADLAAIDAEIDPAGKHIYEQYKEMRRWISDYIDKCDCTQEQAEKVYVTICAGECDISRAFENPNYAANEPELTANMKLAAQIVDSLGEGEVKFSHAGEGKNGGLALHYDLDDGSEFGTGISLVEVFTDMDGYILDHVNVIKLNPVKTVATYNFNKPVSPAPTDEPTGTNEEIAETTEQVTEVKADETPAAGISPDEKLAELVNAAKTAWEAQRDKSFNSTQAETFRAATKAITKFLDTTRGAFKAALPENIIVADNWREGEFSGSSDLPSFVIRDLKTGKTLGTYKTLAEVEAAVVEQVAQVESAQEYKPQTSWENPHTYETEGDLDTDRYLAARNHFTTVEELLPELGELKTEIDATNDKYLLAGIGLLICSHFDLDEARKVFGLILSEYRAEAEATEDDVKKLYNVCAQINFDKTFEHLPEFEYVRDGIKEETLDKAHDIFRAIRYNLGDQALASELSKLADEFGIDRALLLQSSDCRFNPALFDEKSAEPAPEPTGKMKWAAELLDNYTYEFEGDWEAGNGGLARHYKRFNRDGEECGKVVEVFTDKTRFILDHVNIVGKKIRAYYYINGEKLSYFKGEFNFLWSDKYNAGMSMVGGEHLQVEVPDGRRKKFPNFAVGDDEFFKIMSERGACTIGETEPPEIPATVAPVENNLTDKYQAALEGVYVEDDVGDFVPAAGMTNVATDNLMVYRKGDSGFMEEDPDKYVELLDMEEELEDIMVDKKIAEENRKLDEAFTETAPKPPLATFKAKIRSDERGEFFNYDDMTVSAGEAYQLDEPAPVETKLPPAESFTAKRDRLIAERDAANAKLKEAEEALKAAKLAAFNADDAVMDFMEDAVDEMRERIDLPDGVVEVKTTEGNLAFIYTETVYVDCDDLKFTLRGGCSELNGLTLGIYDTPEQIMTAVEQFKAAIERGDKRFDFANPDQNFDKHSLRDSLERAMKIALERHAEFCHAGKLSDAENEMKLYAICAEAMKELGKGARG